VLSGAVMPSNLRDLGDRLLTAWHKRAVGLKALSFACIGVVNTLIDLGVFLTAYNVLGLPLVPANVMAWLVAVSASYVMNSFITFARESGRQLRLRDYGAFVASGVAGMIANTAALVIFSYFMPVLAAKLLAILASFLVNFSLSHFVVFPRRKQARDARSPRG
jgi:putative flippase GtrA